MTEHDLELSLDPFSYHLARGYCLKFPKIASKIYANKSARSLHMARPHTKSMLHTWGNDSKRNPVAKMTSRIIKEAKQPAS